MASLMEGGTNNGTTIIGKLSGMFMLAAMPPMASIRRLCTNYYPRVAFVEDGVIIPGSSLRFIIAGLFCFAEMKSQGQAEFPFKTHPQAVMVAVNSLLMYGFASGAEQVISAASVGPTSVYTIIARLGKMVFVYVFVGCLASLLYF